jgi:hypothetical protein
MRNALLTPWRLKWYSIAVLFGIFLSIIITLCSGSESKILSGRLGGDFAAFYSAGRIVSTVGFNGLYEINHQIETQKDLFIDGNSFLPFPYPPFVAIACIPLSLLSYRIAYVLSIIVNLSAFLVAFICLKKEIKGLEEYILPVFTLSLTFYPFFKAILLGQNSAITFMLFALIWRFTSVGRRYSAGFCMGLLLYKPQFAIPIMGLFALSGRIKIALTSAATICSIIVVGLFFTGIQSYVEWYHFLKWFVPADANHNGYNAVSWIGFLDAIFGTNNKTATILGYAFCSMTVVIISYVWAVGRAKSDFNAQMGFAAVSLVLIPPHLMYYDAGLIILTYAVIMNKIENRKIEIIAFVWLGGMIQIIADKLGFSPLFFVVVITYFLSHVFIATSAMRQIPSGCRLPPG